MSIFASLPLAPADPILGLTDAYLADPRTEKVNLGVGIYYDEQGRQILPAAVRAAEERLVAAHRARSYIPIDGLADYTRLSRELLFGTHPALLEAGRVTTAQTLGGTGALRTGADFLKSVLPRARAFISRPSWPNHRVLFTAAGFEVAEYPYYDPATRGVDFVAMTGALRSLEPGDVVILHACCHNPTGADLDAGQWRTVAELVRERRLIPFIDLAYQGFDQGIAEDAAAIQAMLDAGVESLFVASSYSKSFSLYGERVGALSIVCASAEEAERVRSQVKQTIRATYSNPPTHGAALVATVLGDAALRQQWEDELRAMRERIKAIRQGLVTRLAGLGHPGFDFIERQIGMFTYSGLSAEQVGRLRDEFGIYAVGSGRICVAALNPGNLEHVAVAIAAVVGP